MLRLEAFVPVLDPGRVQRAHEWQYRGDRVGHRVHVVLGILWCLCAAGPTTVVEFGAAPLVGFSLWRVLNVWRTWPSAIAQPLTLSLVAWMAWMAVSLFWSPDPVLGREEFGSLRYMVLLFAMWPIMDRRSWLIGALAAGFAVGQAVQAGDALGGALDIAWLDWRRPPGRSSGWWDPVVGGSLLCGVLGLHLPAALAGTGRARAVGVAGSAAALVGALATGTRGAWIASALLIVIATAWAAWRVRPRRRLLVPAAAGAVLVAGAAVGGWALMGEQISARWRAGVEEVERAVRGGDYRSDTGARLLMWSWAVRAVGAHPLGGVGAGGFRAWTVGEMAKEPDAPPARLIHAHAHSAPLHIAATTGLIGLGLAGLCAAIAIAGGLTRRPGEGAYSAGPAFGIIGLLCAGLFDPVQVNAQTSALLGTLGAMCLFNRPRHPAQHAAGRTGGAPVPHGGSGRD